MSWFDLVSGAISGGITSFLFYPLEYLEARMQVSSKKGFVATITSALREEGVLALYQGVAPTVIGSAVNWGLYFCFFEMFKAFLTNPSAAAAPLQVLLAALFAGAVTTILVNPFWVLKIRMATQQSAVVSVASPSVSRRQSKPTGLVDTARKIVRDEGTGALWAGTSASLLGTSEGAVQLLVYEQARLRFDSFTCGMISKLVAILVTYPYQVVRSRLQAQNAPSKSLSGLVSYIFKQEGVAAFYSGIIPNIVRQLIPAGLFFYLFEFIKSVLLTATLKRS